MFAGCSDDKTRLAMNELSFLQGHDSAMRHLMSIKDSITGLSDQDRISWWMGFITASAGLACGSIGPVNAETVMGNVKEELRLWQQERS